MDKEESLERIVMSSEARLAILLINRIENRLWVLRVCSNALVLKSDPQTSLVILQFHCSISLFIRFFGLLVFVPRRCLT